VAASRQGLMQLRFERARKKKLKEKDEKLAVLFGIAL